MEAYSLEFSNCARTAMMVVGVFAVVSVVGRMVVSELKVWSMDMEREFWSLCWFCKKIAVVMPFT